MNSCLFEWVRKWSNPSALFVLWLWFIQSWQCELMAMMLHPPHCCGCSPAFPLLPEKSLQSSVGGKHDSMCNMGLRWWCSNLLFSKRGSPVETALMCILLPGGNYFRWHGCHHCLMLFDWVLLNYSNKAFSSLTHLPVTFIKSEAEWFVNGLHFIEQ